MSPIYSKKYEIIKRILNYILYFKNTKFLKYKNKDHNKFSKIYYLRKAIKKNILNFANFL
jgi:hypothetical protein